MNNLWIEMARYGVSHSDIQKLLSCSYTTAWEKVNGEREFTISEALKIRSTFFQGMRIEYLFAKEQDSITK